MDTGFVSVALEPGQAVSCTYTNTSPDLGVTKTDTPDPVALGSTLTYTVTATNHGPADATGVVVEDTIDANTTFVSTSLGNDCTFAAGVVTCELGDMANGDVVVFTITVTVNQTARVGVERVEQQGQLGTRDQPDWEPEQQSRRRADIDGWRRRA